MSKNIKARQLMYNGKIAAKAITLVTFNNRMLFNTKISLKT